MQYDLKNTNKRLKDIYGSDFAGRQHLRIVQSKDCVEKRSGTFREFLGDTDILLREYKGVKEVPKYNYIPPEHYVFETLCVDPDNHTYSYEPFYVFQDKDGNRLPLAWRVIEVVADAWLRKDDPDYIKGQIMSEEDLKDRDVREFMDIIDSEASLMQNQFREGEALIMPGTKFDNETVLSPPSIDFGMEKKVN